MFTITSRKEIAYEYIKNAILTDEMKPGSPVIETELSEKLEMSRTPIREALRELEAEGLIESYPARGTVVTVITTSDVEEIYELRVLLEVWALEKSFPYIKESELDYVEKMFMESYKTFDWETYHKADRLLHKLIIEKSRSKRLIGFIETLNVQIERIRRFSAQDPSRKDDSFKEHMDIIDKIRKRDLTASKKSLIKHLRSVSNSAIESCKMIQVTFV